MAGSEVDNIVNKWPRRAFLFGCAVSLLPLRVAAQSPVPGWVGQWRHVNSASEQAAFDREIEGVVSGMGFFVAPFARTRLRERLAPPAQLRITMDASAIEILSDGHAIRTPANGSEVQMTGPRGGQLRVRQRVEGAVLSQMIARNDGSQRLDFRVSADGRTLTVTVTAQSGRLPRPVVLQRVYQRL